MKVEMQAKGGPKQEADFGRLVRMLKDAGYRGTVTLGYEAAEPPLVAVLLQLLLTAVALLKASGA